MLNMDKLLQVSQCFTKDYFTFNCLLKWLASVDKLQTYAIPSLARAHIILNRQDQICRI